MSDVVFRCHSCGCVRPLGLGETIGRREECAQCGADLHSCRNCKFFDTSRNNQCAEGEAEWVSNKEGGNFCGFFAPRTTVDLVGRRSGNQDAKKQFDDLFKI